MNCLRNIIPNKVVWLLVFILQSSIVWAGDISFSLMHPYEEALVKYTNKNQKTDHSQTKYQITQNENKYSLVSEGQGHYGLLKDVRWIKSAEFIEEKNTFRVLGSKIELYDSLGSLIYIKEKEFDYVKKIWVYKHYDKSRQLVKTKKYKIKGPSCDEFTLSHFLKGFIHTDHDLKKSHFYLATNESNYYHVRIIDKGIQKIDILGTGAVSARQYQLMAELGPLTKIMARIVPPTYIWYQDKYPFEWLQYEGKETGVKSPSVVATIIERNPSLTF